LPTAGGGENAAGDEFEKKGQRWLTGWVGPPTSRAATTSRVRSTVIAKMSVAAGSIWWTYLPGVGACGSGDIIERAYLAGVGETPVP